MTILNKLFSATKNTKLWLAVALTLFASSAFAGSIAGTTAGLGQVLQDVVDVINGPLGQIVITLSFVWGIFRVLQQDWLQMCGAFLAGIVLVNVNDIVGEIFGASTTAVEAVTSQAVIVAPVLAEIAQKCCEACTCL